MRSYFILNLYLAISEKKKKKEKKKKTPLVTPQRVLLNLLMHMWLLKNRFSQCSISNTLTNKL